MGALPKKKLTRLRRANRTRSNPVSSVLYIACKNCGKAILTHTVCKYCGFYRGKHYLKIKEEATVKPVTDSK